MSLVIPVASKSNVVSFDNSTREISYFMKGGECFGVVVCTRVLRGAHCVSGVHTL
jgi:hypothetical protein